MPTRTLTELCLLLAEQALDRANSEADTLQLEAERQALAEQIAARRLRVAARAYAAAWGVPVARVETEMLAAVGRVTRPLQRGIRIG